jgi:hypothetical protein
LLTAAITTLRPSGRLLELDELLLELDELLELELELLLEPSELLLEPSELLLEPTELVLLEPGGLPGELEELDGGNGVELDERLELDHPPGLEELLLVGGTYRLLELQDELLELDGGDCGGGFSCPPHGGAQGGAQQLGGYGG